MVRVSGSYCSLFNNVRHMMFHRNLLEMVSAADQEKLHLPAALMKGWKDCVELEIKITEEATGSVNTERMKKLDDERDRLLTNFFAVIEAQKWSPVQQVSDAAVKMAVALKPYVGLQNEPFDSETGHIVGMQSDLEKLTDEVTLLGLTPVVAALKTTNDAYERLRAERRDTNVEQQLPQAREVRPQSDAAFDAVCRLIEASFLLSTDATDRAMIEKLVKRINEEVDKFKVSHKETQSQKQSAADKKKVQELLPAFESAQGFAPHSLTLTGKTAKDSDHAKLYELVSLSGESIWVKVEKDKLVKVPAPTKGIATSKAKAKKEDKK